MNLERLETLATVLESGKMPEGIDRFAMNTVGYIDKEGTKYGCIMTVAVALWEPETLPELYNKDYRMDHPLDLIKRLLCLTTSQGAWLYGGHWCPNLISTITPAQAAHAVRILMAETQDDTA